MSLVSDHSSHYPNLHFKILFFYLNRHQFIRHMLKSVFVLFYHCIIVFEFVLNKVNLFLHLETISFSANKLFSFWLMVRKHRGLFIVSLISKICYTFFSSGWRMVQRRVKGVKVWLAEKTRSIWILRFLKFFINCSFIGSQTSSRAFIAIRISSFIIVI